MNDEKNGPMFPPETRKRMREREREALSRRDYNKAMILGISSAIMDWMEPAVKDGEEEG